MCQFHPAPTAEAMETWNCQKAIDSFLQNSCFKQCRIIDLIDVIIAPARIHDVASIDMNLRFQVSVFFMISGDIICQLLLDVSSKENSRKWNNKARTASGTSKECCSIANWSTTNPKMCVI